MLPVIRLATARTSLLIPDGPTGGFDEASAASRKGILLRDPVVVPPAGPRSSFLLRACRPPATWDRVSASGTGPDSGSVIVGDVMIAGTDQLGRISSALLGNVAATDEMALDPLHPYRAGDAKPSTPSEEPTPPATGPEA